MRFGGDVLTLQAYIISLISVSLLTAIAQIITPEGKLKSVCKTIFSFIVILTIISPFVGGKLKINFDFENNLSDFTVDETAVNLIYEEREKLIEKSCERILEENGIIGVRADVVFNGKVEKVTLNFDDLRITEETEHINIISKTIDILSDFLSVKKEIIEVE